MVELWIGGGIMLILAMIGVFYRPIVCAICDGAMVRTGPNKLHCLYCRRDGHG